MGEADTHAGDNLFRVSELYRARIILKIENTTLETYRAVDGVPNP